MNTNPTYLTRKRYGQIHWRRIHGRAIKVRDRNDLIEFNEMMKCVASTYECKLCSGHIKEYINRVGLPKAPCDAFRWTVEFHNDNNRRLGKPEVTLVEAYLIHS
uniref:thiol oxidase n=1 Tax=viral metagenome TaxID=1070528 RepID=A0A6C0JS84_9ZZZZ